LSPLLLLYGKVFAASRDGNRCALEPETGKAKSGKQDFAKNLRKTNSSKKQSFVGISNRSSVRPKLPGALSGFAYESVFLVGKRLCHPHLKKQQAKVKWKGSAV